MKIRCAARLARADGASAEGRRGIVEAGEGDVARASEHGGTFWALLTGVALGFALQSKYLAAAPTVLWVGAQQTNALLRVWGTRGRCAAALHALLRVTLLLGIPLAMHFALYALHLKLLPRAGTGDGYMSARFQASLHGSPYCATVEAHAALGR
jgi:dolichyl-phosphate-mannose--protein O-mannosyl transferase